MIPPSILLYAGTFNVKIEVVGWDRYIGKLIININFAFSVNLINAYLCN